MRERDAIEAVAAIHDPVRAALYEFVRATAAPVTRDAAAAALALPRSTVAFHLDRLVASGVLTVEYRRLTGRTGPGSGRPSKVYSTADAELSVSIPPRRDDLMGGLLASAIEVAAADGSPVLDALRTTAERAGRAAGSEAGSLGAVLDETGYEPHASEAAAAADEPGVVLSNCPFHHLVDRHAGVVCAANHAFLCGAAAASGTDPERVLLDPAPGRCCVRIAAAERATA
ncbi:MAG: helix-turn-helix domain-containing protein [Pseudolysinimonas sp.]